MASRNSNQDREGLDWQTAPLRIGEQGLDLRRPSEPGGLTELLNARFLDEKTIERRNGHRGYPILAGDGFSSGTHLPDWVYGHGTLDAPDSKVFVPRQHVGRAVFSFQGSNVAWTGDRLITVRENGFSGIGESPFWYGDVYPAPKVQRGIPAMLPLQVDTPVPVAVQVGIGEVGSAAEIETCLTETQRFYAAKGQGDGFYAQYQLRGVVVDRSTGLIINDTTWTMADPLEDVRICASGSTPWIIFLAGGNLYSATWQGAAWSDPQVFVSGASAYDVCPTDTGFYILFRVLSVLKIGRVEGTAITTASFAFGKTLDTTGHTPGGKVGIAIALDGTMGVVMDVDNAGTPDVWCRAFDQDGDTMTNAAWKQLVTGGVRLAPFDRCFITARGLPETDGRYKFVAYAEVDSDGDPDAHGGFVAISTYRHGTSNAFSSVRIQRNSKLRSKPFTVGDTPFCWLVTTETRVCYLLAGHTYPQVCGYADREVAQRPAHHYNQPSMVQRDPLDDYAWTWSRTYYTGVDHAYAGNTLVGDMQFLPKLSVANFGKSVYLSGSAVKNWDGVQLAEAGFQEVPAFNVAQTATAGSLDTGLHTIRVYATRHNALGESFQSAALQKTINCTTNKTVQVTIFTLPAQTADDVVFTVYMSEAAGSALYYVGSVANDKSVSRVTFTIDMADAELRVRLGDPHAAKLGDLSELEEFGPVGCELLVTAGDRLFGAGGQVPRGAVQFSKLWEPGEGAGFDDLAGVQTVDIEGREITSIANFSDTIVLFERERIYLLTGDGPDNYGRGEFGAPRSVLADGAVTHWGTCLTQEGLVFWGVNGPRLLTPGGQVAQISEPVRALAETLTPSGVRIDTSRREVVWYTESGQALLWNYAGQAGRWARWDGLNVAGASQEALVTTDGRVLVDEPDTGDAGQTFVFAFATGLVRPEDLLQGAVQIQRVGIEGDYLGPHTLRMRVFYDGAPLWSQEDEWHPEDGTYLQSLDDVADLTPAQVDALGVTDRAGGYETHKRLRRQECSYVRVYVSDKGADHPTLIPHALSFVLGIKPGLSRTPVNKFGDD